MTANYKNSRPRVRVYFRKQVASWQGGNKKSLGKFGNMRKILYLCSILEPRKKRAENQDRLEFVTYLKLINYDCTCSIVFRKYRRKY